MPKNSNRYISTDIKDCVEGLNQLSDELAQEYLDAKHQDVDAAFTAKIHLATELSQTLLNRIADKTSNDAAAADLKNFLQSMLHAVVELQLITRNQTANAPNPNAMVQSAVGSFEKFFNAIISKSTKDNLATIASYIPCVDTMVLACQSLPYYWHAANRAEKAALVLSIVLLACAITFGIIALVNPGMILAMPIVGASTLVAAALVCSSAANRLYSRMIMHPKARDLQQNATVDLHAALQRQEQDIYNLTKKLSPLPPRKTMLVSKSKSAGETSINNAMRELKRTNSSPQLGSW